MPDPNTGTQGQGGEWYAAAPDEVKGYVQNKGWKDPLSVVDGYRNLEKLHGVPAEQLLKLPKDSDAPETWKSVWERLGAGKTVEDYKLAVPEGDDGAFAKEAAKWFHETGVPIKTAQAMAERWNKHFVEITKKQEADYKLKVDGEKAELAKKWGATHDQNMNLAKRAAAEFGVGDDVVAQLEMAVGYGKVMDLFYAIGSKIGEAAFAGADGKPAGGAKTPEQAKAEIETLKADSEFVKKYLNKDTESLRKVEALHKIAYPE